MMFEFEDLAQRFSWICDRLTLAAFCLIAAISEIALIAGFVYVMADMATHGLFTHLMPLLVIVWAWVQAIAVDIHLAVLPMQAMKHKHNGNTGRYRLAVLVILLLAASAVLSLVAVDWPFLRAAALVGVVLIKRLGMPIYSEDVPVYGEYSSRLK